MDNKRGSIPTIVEFFIFVFIFILSFHLAMSSFRLLFIKSDNEFMPSFDMIWLLHQRWSRPSSFNAWSFECDLVSIFYWLWWGNLEKKNLSFVWANESLFFRENHSAYHFQNRKMKPLRMVSQWNSHQQHSIQPEKINIIEYIEISSSSAW